MRGRPQVAVMTGRRVRRSRASVQHRGSGLVTVLAPLAVSGIAVLENWGLRL